MSKEPDASRATRFPRGHCGRAGCRCTHTDGCDHGWIEGRPYEHRGVSYTGTQEPCPVCRPEAHARWLDGSLTKPATPPPPPDPVPPSELDLPQLWEDGAAT